MTQEQMFAEECMFQTGPLYTVASGVRLTGEPDVGALRCALKALMDRHEMLRSSMRSISGRAVVVVSPPGQAPEFVHEDLREYPAGATRHDIAWRRLDQAQQHRFELSHAPLWRGLLLTLGTDEHWLLLTLHHIIADGWAVGTLWRELAAAYGAAMDGREPDLPPLPVTYLEYAARQRSGLSDTRLSQLLAYWRAQLADLPGELSLPLDRPRPAVRGYQGGAHRFVIPQPLCAEIRRLVSSNRSTMFVVLLAAFARLLGKYAGTEDVTVSVPMANRAEADAIDLVGLLTSPLPLRLRMAPDLTVAELVALARKVTLGAMAHQDIPFDRLAREFAPQRGGTTHPLLQVIFSVQPVPSWEVDFPGLATTVLRLPTGPAAAVDLTVLFYEAGEELRGCFEYRCDVWEPATIERLADHFTNLLSGMVSPGARLTDLSIFGPAEYRQLVRELPASDPAPPAELVHALVERVADRAPETIAVTQGDRHLSYADLDSQANVLAWLLRRRGVGPDQRVAVCLPCGPERVLAWLAVLKAGGAYVPLDPSYPREWLRHVVADAAARVVLTTSQLSGQLGLAAAVGTAEPHLCCLDRLTDELATLPATRPSVTMCPDNLAYVTYTSGSTGRPKGVMVSHRALANLAVAGPLAPVPSDTVAMHTSPAFDVSAYEVWSALCAGARLLAAPLKRRLDPADYRALAGDCSMLFLTPGLFGVLVDQDPEPVAKVPRLVIGGEHADGDRIAKHRNRPGQVTTNGYGPTECTVFAVAGPATLRAPSGAVPIGRPLPGIQAYVLDSGLQPVPLGVTGELHLGGIGLSRGYLNNPALTADRFVPHPFADGERIYRTGDQARWLADGVLECLGRLDEQVKMRGFRIEPGEIEAVLRENDGINDAVLIKRQDGSAGPRLVAYVVPADGRSLDHVEVLSGLRNRLPGHMVPAALVEIAAVPLTGSGKVDRATLSAEPSPFRRAVPVGSFTPTQAAVTSVWQEVLGVNDVGLDDDFFEMSGDSLLALRVVGLLEGRGLSMTLTDMYRLATIRSCAAQIDATAGE